MQNSKIKYCEIVITILLTFSWRLCNFYDIKADSFYSGVYYTKSRTRLNLIIIVHSHRKVLSFVCSSTGTPTVWATTNIRWTTPVVWWTTSGIWCTTPAVCWTTTTRAAATTATAADQCCHSRRRATCSSGGGACTRLWNRHRRLMSGSVVLRDRVRLDSLHPRKWVALYGLCGLLCEFIWIYIYILL